MVTTEKKVYSIDEVSKLLQISKNLTYRLARQRQLPGVIFLGPKRMVVSAAAIDKLLASDNHQSEERPENGKNTERERSNYQVR
ncbi:MAG: helix-turn-helix transcriptional regulator [Chloroflexota bacterium]